MVVVESQITETEPLLLEEMHDKELIWCRTRAGGLTAFTHDLIATHDLKVRPYPGEASSYRVLEERANLGLGSAPVPQSKLTSFDTRHRPLCVDGHEVEIFYEAVWDPNSSLAGDLEILASRIATPN